MSYKIEDRVIEKTLDIECPECGNKNLYPGFQFNYEKVDGKYQKPTVFIECNTRGCPAHHTYKVGTYSFKNMLDKIHE